MKIPSKDALSKIENRNNAFLTLDEGDYKIRILSDIEYILRHKVEVKGKFNFPICPTEMARLHNSICPEGEQVDVPTCALCEAGHKVDGNYLAVALLRYDNGKHEVGILNKNSILKKATNLGFDEDFGDVKEIDLKIKATGKDLARRYDVNPLGKDKSPAITPEEQKSIDEFNDRFTLEDYIKPADEVTLTALANGEDIPF